MPTQITALLVTYALTAVVSAAAALVLLRPLSILLAELCGTERRSRFWTVWSAVVMVATPMLLVSLREVATSPAELVRTTLATALFGTLVALLAMGWAVWSSRTPNAPTLPPLPTVGPTVAPTVE